MTAVLFTENTAQPLLNHRVAALVPTPALAPRATVQLRPTVTLPWCASSISTGWDIGCYADAEEVIGEAFEQNNFGPSVTRGVSRYGGAERASPTIASCAPRRSRRRRAPRSAPRSAATARRSACCAGPTTRRRRTTCWCGA
jgi:hypothetical protein